MSDRYEETGPGIEVQDPFRDGDDDFDYEGYYRRQPLEAAASIGRPELADEISFFGVEELRGEQLTPELVTAMENFQNIAAQYETQRTPELKAQYEQGEGWPRSLLLRPSVVRSGGTTSSPVQRILLLRRGLRGTSMRTEGAVPATPVFDSTLKAPQEQLSTGTERGSAGRVKAFLRRIRKAEKKNDLSPDMADSARGLEQARSRGLRRGR